MAEKWKGVTVKTDLLPKGTRRSGQKLVNGKAKFIVAHDTGNPNSTAQQNVNYYKNTYNININQTASAHIFVDDKEAIICVPTDEKAWHVLYNAPADNKYYGIDANDGAIGVEICYFSDKKRSQKALDNGARVLAYLAEYWGINYKTHMPGHQDIQSDKQDPGNALQASGYGRATSNLDKIVAKYYKKGSGSTSTPSKPKPSKPSKPKSKLKVGQKAPKTLAHKSSKQFIAKADSAGITVCKKVGSKYQKTNLVYKAGTPNFHVYEVKDGWARIYSKDSNLWVWHERLIITKVM